MKAFVFIALPVLYVCSAFMYVLINSSSHNTPKTTAHAYDAVVIVALLLSYFLLLKLRKKLSYEAGSALMVVVSLVLTAVLPWITLGYTWTILDLTMAVAEHLLFIDCLPLYAVLAISYQALRANSNFRIATHHQP